MKNQVMSEFVEPLGMRVLIRSDGKRRTTRGEDDRPAGAGASKPEEP